MPLFSTFKPPLSTLWLIRAVPISSQENLAYNTYYLWRVAMSLSVTFWKRELKSNLQEAKEGKFVVFWRNWDGKRECLTSQYCIKLFTKRLSLKKNCACSLTRADLTLQKVSLILHGHFLGTGICQVHSSGPIYQMRYESTRCITNRT